MLKEVAFASISSYSVNHVSLMGVLEAGCETLT